MPSSSISSTWKARQARARAAAAGCAVRPAAVVFQGMTATPFAFDEFVVDPIGRTLFHHGTPVPLNSKAFDTLLLLVSNAGDDGRQGDAARGGVAGRRCRREQPESGHVGAAQGARRYGLAPPLHHHRSQSRLSLRAARHHRAGRVAAPRRIATPGVTLAKGDTETRALVRSRVSVRALLAGGDCRGLAIAVAGRLHAVRFSSGGPARLRN